MKAPTKKEKRVRRQGRIRAKISGTSVRPRLAVFKSNRFTTLQVIDDTKGMTLVAGTTKGMKKGTAKEKAFELGEIVAKTSLTKKITAVVFDRGGFAYTGVIKEVADGARKGGLKF
ncbi:MAG: 50S ribosomal protein L18 [Candidatus Campbellbacteria bacterium]|nr:50S ribosomal protein L18 [Candidatus Campbellbacteria bacterium]